MLDTQKREKVNSVLANFHSNKQSFREENQANLELMIENPNAWKLQKESDMNLHWDGLDIEQSLLYPEYFLETLSDLNVDLDDFIIASDSPDLYFAIANIELLKRAKFTNGQISFDINNMREGTIYLGHY